MNRFQRRYELLRGQGRCVRCTKTLPPECPTYLCPICQGKKNTSMRDVARKAGVEAIEAKRKRREDQISSVIATAHKRTARQQAEDLGITVDRVYALRAIARRRGHDVPIERGGHQGGIGYTTGRWDALDGEMAVACKLCGLRGPHECIHGDATARPGPGRVFPSHGW